MRLARLTPAVALSLLAASVTSTVMPAYAGVEATPRTASLLPQPQELLGRLGEVTVGSFGYDIAPDAVLPDGSTGTAVMRWNPCKPIDWAIDTDFAPKGFVAEARRAVTELAHATGFRMVFAGTTAQRPQAVGGQLVDGPIRATGVQLVIAWDDPADAGSLLAAGSGAAGMTLRQASTSRGPDGSVSPSQYDLAAITLDRRQEKALVRNDTKGNGLYHVLLHELGHAAGLNHVSDPHEVMTPVATASSPVHYAAGDRTGLRQLGSDDGCL